MDETPAPVIPNPFDFLPQAGQEAANANGDVTGNATGNMEASTEDSVPDTAIRLDSEDPAPNVEAAKAAESDLNPEADRRQVGLGEIDGENEIIAEPGIELATDEVLETQYQRCLVVELDGEIAAPFYYYLNNRLDMAKSIGADLIVLKLTSPGGELEKSLDLARRIRDIDWATVAVLIPREAISGGAILSLGADRIYMIRGSLIGDAGPIKLGIRGFELADQKIVSYLTAAINELATSTGRPAAIAEAMADKSQIVLEVIDRQSNSKAYLRKEEVEQEPARYEVIGPIPEAGQDRFLTLGAEKAFEYGLVEGIFASEKELMQQLLVNEFQYTQMNWVDRTVVTLNRPWLTGLLLIIGLIGLYMELVAPGLSVAGLTSVVCFGVFFWSHALGGTSGWLEVMLFGLAVFCLVCELFVVPGFGVFGVVGILLLVVSLVMASQDFVVPETAAEWRALQTNVLIVLGSVLGVMLLFFGQILLLDRIPGFSKFQLVAPGDTDSGNASVEITSLTATASTQVENLEVGKRGVADSDLRPSGKVYVDNRLLDVVTEGDYVEAGSAIEVIKIEGNSIIVRRVIS